MKAKSKVLILVLLSIILLTLGLFSYHHHLINKKHQAQSTITMDALFIDDDHAYLNPEIDEDMIQAAKDNANKLAPEKKEKALKEIAFVEQKQAAIQAVDQIYQHDDSEAFVVGDKVNPRDILNNSVSLADLKKLAPNFDFAVGDALSDELKIHYKNALEIVQLDDKLQSILNDLPTSFQADQIIANLKKFNEISQLLEDTAINIEGQPRLKNSLQAITNKTKIYAKSLIQSNPPLKDDVLNQLLNQPLLGQYLTGSSIDHRKLIALTFDDGPSENTGAILDILDQYGIKAMFFQQGNHVKEYPQVSQRILAEGHKLGNHTYDHPYFSNLRDKEVVDEISQGEAAIKEATGISPKYIRNPHGAQRRRIARLRPDLTGIYWDIDSEDWKSMDTKQITQRVLSQAHNHAVILHHDTIKATAEAMKKYIPELKKQGYTFVFADQIPEVKNWINN
ncbi:polysaccharide deacetylase family protein [Aerococcus urinae]|uniref:Polysaccharide deacetylase family protein n=1 Tax=Aerococcus urinae TaxID=1376 RepID=A0A0X8FEZ9_9LACT|nr:polysaccharide deacetylase family protein [Aerococcus urinae]AMB95302.1 hypothetical protein AWM73_01665 [Aerococcus urinae]MCY3032025.1 polysaccharide deacetylase family protein [Aerococcus urinae]MCY3036982.1 polysaccharide deacetylase family protein [Aerococcus urinae]MCY3044072.1 polysaccharide deacetylase family protein [Aerococcus urinae]MCY3046872.1 polysaccharide deacetylase family protein [Aerococcus urinae]